jgi:hypothetical protein
MSRTANYRNWPELNERQEMRELIIFEGVELCCHRSGHFYEQADTWRFDIPNLRVTDNKKAECILTTHSAFWNSNVVLMPRLRLFLVPLALQRTSV